jgi:IS30 family transposase
MKTIKQIADELNVDKQQVYRYIRKNRISEAHHEAQVMWFDDAAEIIINKHFSTSNHISDVLHKPHQTTSPDAVSANLFPQVSGEVSALIAMLQKELDIKNEQIKDLNLRLAESNAALVAAQQTTQTEQALHAGTIRKQLVDGRADQPAADTPSGFFARIFSRKR